MNIAVSVMCFNYNILIAFNIMASSLVPLNCPLDIERKRTMDTQFSISKSLGLDVFWI